MLGCCVLVSCTSQPGIGVQLQAVSDLAGCWKLLLLAASSSCACMRADGLAACAALCCCVDRWLRSLAGIPQTTRRQQ